MDRRLEAAAHAGDVGALRQLLEEDKLLLHRPLTAAPYPIDNPLHIAALLGHFEFAREILTLNPGLARSLNGEGHSPLHLASANGHLMVVKELLSSSVGTELCALKDKDGLLPIHTAAMNGKVDVLEALVTASPESVRARTCQGDGVLHLAVKSNHFQAVKFLVERMEEYGELELLKSGDAKGNTILHLATARKQYETLKLLLRKPWADVNAMNMKGSTILDVLLESPYKHGDLMLGEMIRTAGGRISSEGDQIHHQPPTQPPSDENNAVSNVEQQRPINHKRNWKSVGISLLKYPLSFVGLGFLVDVDDSEFFKDSYKTAPDTLLIVATLTATITFQGALNPPGGFATREDAAQALSPGAPPLTAGQALLSDKLDDFVFEAAIALLASLTVILVLISSVPKWKMVIRILMWLTWVSVFYASIAFKDVITIIYPKCSKVFKYGLYIVGGALLGWISIRCIAYLLNLVHIFSLDHWRGLIWLVTFQEGKENTVTLYRRRFISALWILGVMVFTAGVIYFLVDFYSCGKNNMLLRC